MKSSTTVLGRWRRFLFAPFSVLAAVTLVTSAASAAQAATVINTDVPVRIVAFNPCNGEALALDGMGHFVFRVAYENNGAVLVGEHYNIHVTGTGDKGNTYVGNSEELSEENAELGLEETTTLSFEAISTGFAPNFLTHSVFHVTVNPDGTVTAFVSDSTAECRG